MNTVSILTQIIVDLDNTARQAGDAKDRQGDYISDNIDSSILELRRLKEALS